QGTEPRTRALLVISDGEDHSDGFRPALASAEAAGITVFAAGVGTPEGANIPVHRSGRLVGYKTDRHGEVVTTRLEDAPLRRLADGSTYVRIDRTGRSLSEITDALARLDRTVLASEAFEAYAEQYQWPLALALLLLAAERLVAFRRKPA